MHAIIHDGHARIVISTEHEDVPKGARVIDLKRAPKPDEFFDGEGWAIDDGFYLSRIDREAEVQRGRVQTPGIDYAAKEREARAVLAGGGSVLIEAEAKALGIKPEDLAETIIAKALLARPRLAAIEAARVAAKARVRSLKSRAGKERAAAVDWDAIAP